MTRAAMQQALEALENSAAYEGFPSVRRAAASLRAALAEQQGEAPAGWKLVRSPITEDMHVAASKVLARASGLDGTPQRMLDAMLAAQPQRQPLTDEQTAALTIMLDHYAGDPRTQCLRPLVERAYGIEAKL